MHNVQFLASSAREILPGRPAILGCPLDVTSTYRSGSDIAPNAIRMASDSIETYSPFLDMDLEDQPFSDLGDLDIAGQLLDSSLDLMEQAASIIHAKGGRLLALGGEHTITLPLVKALHASFPDLVLIHADAHSDLRDEYEGRAINHATVIKRISEIIGADRLIQLGIRSGTRAEFAWMHENGTLLSWDASTTKELSKRVAGRPVYFTLDLDVLDPSCLHATGNPEPGGWFYSDMERLFQALRKMRLIAADVVELNPQLDPSQVGTITASKIVRELLLILGATAMQT